MTKQLFIIAIIIATGFTTTAQTFPLPKHEIAKPQANVKMLELKNVIEGRWRGARITQLPGAVNVDSVWLEIKPNGTLSFKHQKYEFNGPTTGTYSITKNKIVFTCNKFPFNHTLMGDWSIHTGMITGNYTELRERDNTQAAYYSPGRNTGTFNLIKY